MDGCSELSDLDHILIFLYSSRHPDERRQHALSGESCKVICLALAILNILNESMPASETGNFQQISYI